MSDEKKRKKRETVPPGDLPETTKSVLRRLVGGDSLAATRQFPYDWTFAFNAEYRKVSVTAVSTLVDRGLITATQTDPCADFILYHPTDAGRRFVVDGPPPPDDSQQDWTTGVTP